MKHSRNTGEKLKFEKPQLRWWILTENLASVSSSIKTILVEISLYLAVVNTNKQEHRVLHNKKQSYPFWTIIYLNCSNLSKAHYNSHSHESRRTSSPCRQRSDEGSNGTDSQAYSKYQFSSKFVSQNTSRYLCDNITPEERTQY